MNFLVGLIAGGGETPSVGFVDTKNKFRPWFASACMCGL